RTGRAGRADAACARVARPGPPRRDRAPLPPRVHARRDRRTARPAAGHRQLAPAPRPRQAEGAARVKRELQRVEIPGEYDARRRTWEVVRAAYLERQPVSWPRRHLRSLALTAAVIAIVAAAVTPPGRSVVNSIRDAVGRAKVPGVRNPQREPVRLPAPGRLLVQSPRAAWVVQQDGSRRRLGPYRDVAWSPHGLFVAGVLNARDLVALEPNGKVRWEKPNKRRVAFPRWSFEGFRIAYFAGSTLRVIAGEIGRASW